MKPNANKQKMRIIPQLTSPREKALLAFQQSLKPKFENNFVNNKT